MTDRLYLRDADLRSFVATVVAVDGDRVELDRTAFYATSGGQPHDTGHLVWAAGAASVIDVVTVDGTLWHTLAGPIPGAETGVSGEAAAAGRRQLSRPDTAPIMVRGVMGSRCVAQWDANAVGFVDSCDAGTSYPPDGAGLEQLRWQVVDGELRILINSPGAES